MVLLKTGIAKCFQEFIHLVSMVEFSQVKNFLQNYNQNTMNLNHATDQYYFQATNER